ncbi:methyl-accepting chemotaxis protein [Paenibacillus donghaensis]|uniref:Methyl-accepting chemotaxis protein n=1 Tax=Paenibacillus donghaensis TaxID=414771 RepID=A0A2Z2KA12_9BACL|nr:methyl-accepting chemotaxis protein [Paenibacillus donghaensis]ASA19613.1 methyl-accepting chemotaxis protein [Paenibacillus donghaensis]
MFRFKQSISRKITRLLFVVLLLTSLLLSISFYFISVSIFNSYVAPQINKSLTAAGQDVYKSINTTFAQQTLSNGEQARTQLEFYFKEKQKQHGSESIYLLNVKDGKPVVLAAERSAKLKPQESVELQPAMEQALKSGKLALSDMYSDSHGIHISSYINIPGSTMLVGVNADVRFIEEKLSNILWTSAGITLAAMVVSMVGAMFMSRRITRPITKLAAYSNKLAEGDFTQELHIKGSDEVGQLSESFRTMTERLKGMIGQVLNTSNTVVMDANDLKERVAMLNEMASHSSQSVEEIGKGSTTIAVAALDNARAMEEINLGIQQIASSAGEVTEQISEASDQATGGNDTAQHAVEQMRQVQRASQKSLQQFQTMNERSLMIGEVVQGITEITKQIQMLSLNASIEAARAGEHGRGFAVVAGEVRKLSEQSRNATEQIREFLMSLQEDMNRSVTEMNQVNAEVASGAGKVAEAGDAFSQLLILIQSIDQNIQSVSAATQQISAGTEEVSASVEETAQITAKSQANADTLQQNSDRQRSELDAHGLTVEHLHEQAIQLQEAVKQFKI